MGTNKKMSLEEKKKLMKEFDKERTVYEAEHLGGYEVILPSTNPKYKEYIETAKKIWTAYSSSNV